MHTWVRMWTSMKQCSETFRPRTRVHNAWVYSSLHQVEVVFVLSILIKFYLLW